MENNHGIAILDGISKEWERVFGTKLETQRMPKLPYETGKFRISQILKKG